MSYPYKLRFLVGRLLVITSNETEEIVEKACIINVYHTKQNSDNQDVNESNDEEMEEIWKSESESVNHNNLGITEFRIVTDPITFRPTCEILSDYTLSWLGRDGIKNLLYRLKQLKPLKHNCYRLFYTVNTKPPGGIITSLSKLIGKNLLEQIDVQIKKSNQSKIYWAILLGPKSQNMLNRQPIIVENKFGEDPFISNNQKAYEILAESLSTNCANIEYVF
jgi:hypothetical protein